MRVFLFLTNVAYPKVYMVPLIWSYELQILNKVAQRLKFETLIWNINICDKTEL